MKCWEDTREEEPTPAGLGAEGGRVPQGGQARRGRTPALILNGLAK